MRFFVIKVRASLGAGFHPKQMLRTRRVLRSMWVYPLSLFLGGVLAWPIQAQELVRFGSNSEGSGEFSPLGYSPYERQFYPAGDDFHDGRVSVDQRKALVGRYGRYGGAAIDMYRFPGLKGMYFASPEGRVRRDFMFDSPYVSPLPFSPYPPSLPSDLRAR